MIVGQRVLLKKFGWGTILGFEAILKINDVVASRAIETGRPDDRILVQDAAQRRAGLVQVPGLRLAREHGWRRVSELQLRSDRGD